MADYLVTETQITFCAWLVKATSEEDARKVWEGSGPDVQLVDQQVTDSQGLTITEGAGGYRWPASPPSVADVLARAESFIAGFEDDKGQEGIPELLRDIRAAQGKEG